MMRTSCCCLAVLLFALPALAADRPACLPAGAVLANAEDAMGGWLLKSGADDVKRHLGKVAGGGSWERDTLMTSCKLAGQSLRMKVVTVSASGEGVPDAGDAKALAALAARTGHTRQEADVLARRYGELSHAFFRSVRDEGGNQLSERELILRKHARRVGGVDPEADAGEEGEMDDAAAQAFEKKIEAAQERGDMEEVLRLAEQAKKAAAPATAKARQDGRRVEQQRWQVLERAYAELAAAAYRTAVTFGQCPCMQCDPPQPPSR